MLLKEIRGHTDTNTWDRQRKSVLDVICCWEDKSLIAAMHKYEATPDGAIWWREMGAQGCENWDVYLWSMLEVHVGFQEEVLH